MDGTRTGLCRTALIALAILAATPPAAGAATQQYANVTVAYELDQSSLETEVWTPAQGTCYPRRGTIERSAGSRTRTVARGRLYRTPLGRRVEFSLTASPPTLARPNVPVAVDYRRTVASNLESYEEDETVQYEGTGCPPRVWRRMAGQDEPPDQCRIRGGLFLQERLGRVLAAFRAGRARNCEGDGYPGTTNYLRPYGRVSQARLYSGVRNTFGGTATKRSERRERGGTHDTSVTLVETWKWKVTLVRTSGWRTGR